MVRYVHEEKSAVISTIYTWPKRFFVMGRYGPLCPRHRLAFRLAFLAAENFFAKFFLTPPLRSAMRATAVETRLSVIRV